MQLGSAYLQSGSDEKALAAFQRAIEADSGTDTLNSDMLNSVAYALAERKKGLRQALQYAEKAVHDVEEESSKIQVSKLEIQNLAVSNRLAAYWDTLGWVHFGLGNLDEAERYLKAAWAVTQDAVIGDHLGQVYAKIGKKQQAAHAYRARQSETWSGFITERQWDGSSYVIDFTAGRSSGEPHAKWQACQGEQHCVAAFPRSGLPARNNSKS